MPPYPAPGSPAPHTEQNLPAPAFAPHLPQNLAVCRTSGGRSGLGGAAGSGGEGGSDVCPIPNISSGLGI